MSAQRHVRGALVLIASLLAAPLHASCGCEAADDRPCVQETLATVPMTAQAPAIVLPDSAGLELSLQECWDCGGPNDFLPAFVIALLLLPPLIALKRLAGSEQLIVLRLDLLSCPRTPAAAPAVLESAEEIVLSRRPLVNASRLHRVFA